MAGDVRLRVTQVKSKISERYNQRETLRSLGLKKVGQWVIRPDDSQTRGYLRAVAHLVRVEELDDGPHAKAPHPQPTQPVTSGSHEMSNLLQSVGAEMDGFKVLPTGDFLEWHRSGADRSLLWSTTLPVDAMVRSIARIQNADEADELGVVVVDSERRTMPSSEIAEVALSKPDHISFLRIELSDGASILWSRKSGNPSITADSEYGEASIIFDASSRNSAEVALSATATERLGKLAGKIVELVVTARS